MTSSSATLFIVSCMLASSCAIIDVSRLDADHLRQYTLMDIASEIAVQFPVEMRKALNRIIDDNGMVEEIFDQLSSVDQYAREGRCPVCMGLFTVVARMNDTRYAEIVQMVIDGCHLVTEGINENLPNRVDIKSTQLCDGTVNLQAPHVFNVLKSFQTAAVAAANFCEKRNICFPSRTSSASTATMSISGRVTSILASDGDQLPPRERNNDDVITVVQLTDIHVEQLYAIGSPTNCGLPVCCLDKWRGQGTGEAKHVAEYSCNVPQHTVELFLSKVNEMNPDVILFSGDIPPHTVWDETEESQTNCTVLLTESISRILPNHTVYPCIGNHETYPTNLFSLGALNYTQAFTDKFYQLWQPIAKFDSEQQDTIKKGGYYSTLIMPGLRLLAYNSVYMYTYNWYNTINLRTPVNSAEVTPMKDYMRQVLEDARTNNEKVLLLGHHPIGGADFIVSESRWYQQLVVDFHDIIVLQPTGHTHYDEIRLIYNSTGHPVSVVLVSPSISSGGTKNPSMRVFYLDKLDFSLVDYEQHFIDLSPSLVKSRQGQVKQQRAEEDPALTDAIRLLYSAKSRYEMPDLSPQSWHDLTERFIADPDVLHRHLEFRDAWASKRNICLSRCQHNYICRQRNGDFDKYLECSDTFNDTLTTAAAIQTSTEASPASSTLINASSSAFNVNLLVLVYTVAVSLFARFNHQAMEVIG